MRYKGFLVHLIAQSTWPIGGHFRLVGCFTAQLGILGGGGWLPASWPRRSYLLSSYTGNFRGKIPVRGIYYTRLCHLFFPRPCSPLASFIIFTFQVTCQNYSCYRSPHFLWNFTFCTVLLCLHVYSKAFGWDKTQEVGRVEKWTLNEIRWWGGGRGGNGVAKAD